MPPSIQFEALRRLHHGEDEKSLVQDNIKSKAPLLQKEGRRLWEQSSRKRSETVSDDDVDPAIRLALSSIRVLANREENQEWLDEFQGTLYDVPVQVLERVAARAPCQFTARVADFNDNLLYEMQTERGLCHLGLEEVQDMLQGEEYLGSFLTTESSLPQPAHVDYTWEVLEEKGRNLQIGFFPLTREGMFLQIWPREDTSTEIEGEVIFVPFGKLLVVPAKTIHGGGFRTTVDAAVVGNLRFHLYLARKSTQLPTHQSNKYTEPNDKTKELSRRYVDSPRMPDLLKCLFV